MHHISPYIILLLSCLTTLSLSSEDCLSQISVADISSYQANISWTYDCDQSQVQGFKIYYDHVRYRACSDSMNKDRGKQVREKSVRNIEPHERFRVIGDPENDAGLKPYSDYKFTVLAVKRAEFGHGGEKSVTGTTEKSLPRVDLRPGVILGRGSDLIRFRLESDWRDSQCDQLNTQPGRILYEVRGMSPWNGDHVSEGEVGLDSTEITVTGLQPFSQYAVKLYVTDKSGQFDSRDEEMFSPMSTSAGEPQPPADLAILSGASVVWSDPYPPTGDISAYQVSWRQEDGTWTQSDKFSVSKTELLESGQRSVRLEELNIPKQTSLRLRSFTAGVGGSVWSSPVSESDGQMTTVLIVIVVIVAIVTIVTIAFLVIRKCNLIQQYQGFKRTKTYDSSRPIIREPLSSTSIQITPARQPSTESHTTPVVMRPSPSSNRSSVGSSRNSKSRSVQDPLPPVPGEPFYEQLRPKPAEDEDGYMIPKMASMESLDDEGYLKPNFNRFQPLDTRREGGTPPPIPMVSYSSQDQLARTTDM